MNAKNIGGIIPALITPYDRSGAVNEAGLRKLVARLLDQGVGGFYVGGSTGEAFLLTVEERRRIIEIVVNEVGGRVPVIYHVGSISTDEAVALARHGANVGADGISAIPPFYYKFSFAEIKAHYFELADATDLPFIVYNFPAFSGVELDTARAGELFAHARIVGIKHTSKDLYMLERMKSVFTDVRVLNGHDEVLLSSLVAGADGAVGSTYNVMADKYVSLVRAFESGDLTRARQLQSEANEVIATLIEVGVYQGLKYLLERTGVPVGECRKPFGSLSDEGKRKLDAVRVG